jgi:thymidylate synthase
MPELLTPSIDIQYRNLVKKILKEGSKKDIDPQGVGNISLHGPVLKFDLSTGYYPLLGLRDLKGSRKAMAEELFWIMSGSTNVQDLHKQGVHVWDQWAEATKKDFPEYQEGSLGPVYGKQWRAFNGGGEKPVDQLSNVLKLLKENPSSRRMVISVWNPEDVEHVFIAPCIRYLQFHHADGKLGLTVIQGSADVPVGVPFDIAEYALFLRMVAQVNNMQPAILDYHLVDAHIYYNQIPAMQELIKRKPTPQPKLNILSQPENIFGFKREDFELVGYEPLPKMEVPVAL